MKKRAKYSFWHLQHKVTPYIFVSPFILLFCAFMLYPLIKSIYLAFTCTNGPHSIVFVGIDNFTYLLSDKTFWIAVKNTLTYALYSVAFQLPCSLGLALLLNHVWLKGKNIFRFAFFAPYLCGNVFVAVLFSVLFVPQFGLINRTIHWVSGSGLDIKWLSNPSLVMPALIIVTLWLFTGFNMIYFLAALQNVDQQLYEAADIDGATSWQKFRHVTLPGIKPIALFVVIMSTIGSFKLFELPYILLNSSGGPDRAGLTIVMYLYQTGFETGNLGYACAIGWALVALVMTISIIQLYIGRDK